MQSSVLSIVGFHEKRNLKPVHCRNTCCMVFVIPCLSPSVVNLVQVPEQPQNLEATVQSSSSVLVRWEPPIDTFGDLLGYRLFYAAQDGLASREEEVLVTGTSEVVEGLEPYTVYGFRVLAVNENGRGASTGDVQVETFTASKCSMYDNKHDEWVHN